MSGRLAAFARRASWLRPLGSNSYTDQINNMIAHFDHMGVVESRQGPTSGPFPQVFEVEDLHPDARALAATLDPRAAASTLAAIAPAQPIWATSPTRNRGMGDDSTGCRAMLDTFAVSRAALFSYLRIAARAGFETRDGKPPVTRFSIGHFLSSCMG